LIVEAYENERKANEKSQNQIDLNNPSNYKNKR